MKKLRNKKGMSIGRIKVVRRETRKDKSEEGIKKGEKKKGIE